MIDEKSSFLENSYAQLKKLVSEKADINRMQETMTGCVQPYDELKRHLKVATSVCAHFDPKRKKKDGAGKKKPAE